MDTNSAERISELYRRLGGAVYARCVRLLQDRAAAEDATQEIFLRAWRRADAAPSGAAALPWLYRVTSNYCANRRRDDGRRQTEALGFDVADARDVERQLVYRELAERALTDVPEALQRTVELCLGEGLTHGEAATRLGVRRRTVLYRLERFRAEATRRLGQAA
jgi:RNA polymerase sigma-70 factor (ECF subfamily)